MKPSPTTSLSFLLENATQLDGSASSPLGRQPGEGEKNSKIFLALDLCVPRVELSDGHKREAVELAVVPTRPGRGWLLARPDACVAKAAQIPPGILGI